MSLTILTVEHPSRGCKGKHRKSSFPLEGKCRCCGKGCKGQSVAMTLHCHFNRQTAACLPMQSLTILITVHPRAAAAALSPSRGRKGKRRKTRFPLRGSAAVAAKGCTGWSVVMTLYRHPDRQTAACLPMQSLAILTVENSHAAVAALSPSRGRKILVPLSTFATPQGGARD